MNKRAKKIILYLTAFIYGLMGIFHLAFAEKFLFMMPVWLPYKMALIFISGIAEILLAVFLIPKQTRRISAWLIVAMLLVYLFLIHVPQAIDYYKTQNKNFVLTVLRIPLQFLFIYLIWPGKHADKRNRTL